MGQVFAVIVGRLISTVTACRRFLLTIPSTYLPILFSRLFFGRGVGFW